nr:immunoglobulin heavy chain junction region [Macaca mulatta]MOY26138.1 immunoglobulin heavy chain junction region [Macaca mulatta]MOY27491.1 immunoglobulin heavy chain junction region [Macaca mulatta]MOY30518.1 immunoglobulin heavy chain junction region [Macaca mulatta]
CANDGGETVVVVVANW